MAYRERALAVLGEIDRLEVLLSSPALEGEQGQFELTMTVTGNAADPGTELMLEFAFYERGERIGTKSARVTAPAKGQTTTLRVALDPEFRPRFYSYSIR